MSGNNKYLIKYVAPAQRDNNNDKRLINLPSMALGMLETTQNLRYSTQTAGSVA